MRPTGKMAAAAAVALAQSYHSYQEMDCQALIEQAVRNVGGQMDYRGSNDMARSAAWLGTLENARAEGKLAPGALLFIHEDDESGLPARYQGDGFGDFSHVGMYVGDHKMIHCGNPISYASIESNYWKQHFYCFGRIRN